MYSTSNHLSPRLLSTSAIYVMRLVLTGTVLRTSRPGHRMSDGLLSSTDNPAHFICAPSLGSFTRPLKQFPNIAFQDNRIWLGKQVQVLEKSFVRRSLAQGVSKGSSRNQRLELFRASLCLVVTCLILILTRLMLSNFVIWVMLFRYFGGWRWSKYHIWYYFSIYDMQM